MDQQALLRQEGARVSHQHPTTHCETHTWLHVRQAHDRSSQGPEAPPEFNRLQFEADFEWWRTFTQSWNGVALFPKAPVQTVALGAWCGDQWWQWQCPRTTTAVLPSKFFFAVVISLGVWRRGWNGQRVRAHCEMRQWYT